MLLKATKWEVTSMSRQGRKNRMRRAMLARYAVMVQTLNLVRSVAIFAA